ncbi:MAG: hypothetical protein H0V33_09970 [Acidimicrobiia bacterium]|jgi:hypothetical protein|nr:hypothetical protein [Acidimicrobiia bacterium]
MLARRRRDRSVAAAAAVALVSLAACLYTVMTLPLDLFDAPSSHQVRPLLPVSVFVTGVVLVAALRGLIRLGDRGGRSWPLAVPAVAAAAAVLAGGLTLPAWNPEVGPTEHADAIPSVQELTAQLGPLADEPEPILFDERGLQFDEAYSTAVLLALQLRGIESASLIRSW